MSESTKKTTRTPVAYQLYYWAMAVFNSYVSHQDHTWWKYLGATFTLFWLALAIHPLLKHLGRRPAHVAPDQGSARPPS